MYITLAMVMTVDGKITKWDNPHIHNWTSVEDQKHFASLIELNNCIIMGKNTYLAAKSMMKLSSDRLRVVITRRPEDYIKESVPNQLEFTNDQPKVLIEKLTNRGFTRALLAGGSHINTMFFKEKLVNEFQLTIEPKLFASGTPIIAEGQLNVNLQLKNVKQLNEKGTALLEYIVGLD